MRKLVPIVAAATLAAGMGYEYRQDNLGFDAGEPFIDTAAIKHDASRGADQVSAFILGAIRGDTAQNTPDNKSDLPPTRTQQGGVSATPNPAALPAPSSAEPSAEPTVPHYDNSVTYATLAATRQAAFDLWESTKTKNGVLCPRTPSGGKLIVAGKLLCVNTATSAVSPLPGGAQGMFSAPAALVDQISGTMDTTVGANATLQTIPDPGTTCTIIRATLLSGMDDALRYVSGEANQHFFVELTDAGPCNAAVQPPSSPVQRVR